LKALLVTAGSFQNLKKIRLGHNQITDEGLKALVGVAGKLKNLQ
jgi:hypothetical protein